MKGQRPVLVTGASGYVGGRLVPRLVERGVSVRCLARDPVKLEAREWAGHEEIEIVRGDVADRESLARALSGCRAAYYLVHSMYAAGPEYRERDRKLAELFAESAEEAGLDRIVYLGGLGETGTGLSEHLSSRRETGEALGSRRTPVTTLRAAMIIGSGSASFEILRYLVERLPAMITPRWVHTECQPVAIRDVLFYLAECLEIDETAGKTIDIGGPEIVSYMRLMELTAEALRLPRRLVIPVPVLTPRLSSLWIHLVTPIDRRIARPLAEGLRNRVVCRDDTARRLMPHEPLSARAAIELAVGRLRGDEVETSWSDAGAVPGDPDWSGGTVFTDERSIDAAAPASEVFAAVCRIGGRHGWVKANTLWRLRGAIDRLVGGPGLGRGRRHPRTLRYGDALDFWRVAQVESDRRLDLRAEMRLPGEAELSFRIDGAGEDRCRLTQTARFRPRGLLGLAYWYAVLPLHGIVFNGMLRGIASQAEKLHARRAARAADSVARKANS